MTTASSCPEHKVERIEDAGGREYCPACVQPGTERELFSQLATACRRFLDVRYSEDSKTFQEAEAVLHGSLDAAEEFIEETSVGVFEKGNRMAAGQHNRKQRGKPYSDAARQLFECPIGQFPDGWPKDRMEWTTAQEVAEQHAVLARRGDVDAAKFMIERIEGKAPMAPEDREAALEGNVDRMLGGLSALNALRSALGLGPVVEVEFETVEPKQPTKLLKGKK